MRQQTFLHTHNKTNRVENKVDEAFTQQNNYLPHFSLSLSPLFPSPFLSLTKNKLDLEEIEWANLNNNFL